MVVEQRSTQYPDQKSFFFNFLKVNKILRKNGPFDILAVETNIWLFEIVFQRCEQLIVVV